MLWSEGHQFVTTPQNCSELWNAATRPMNKNGFGLSISEANSSLRLVERLFPLLPDTPAIYPEWRRLVVQTGVSGVQVHDARLVAAMLVHGVTHILTFNVADFNRYAGEGVVVVDPTTV
jgi:predicted nucleic acid-binding protein